MDIKTLGDWAPSERIVEPLSLDSLSILNIEGPILRSEADHKANIKAGPHLVHASLPLSLQAKKGIIAALANNHLMDYGVSGLAETLRRLDASGIPSVGAGKDIATASKPLIIEHQGMRIGILARCEVQFGIATDRRPGVAPLDATVFAAIRKLKRETDVVIASVHAAAEMCPWPSPNRQDTWRALIDAGADVVHGHHAHVPQGWESYEGGLIFYGLGNLCVDPRKWVEHPNALWSLAPELFWSNGVLTMHPATAVIEDRGKTVRVRDASPTEADRHRSYLAQCNRPLSDRPLLEGLWQEASIRMYQHHYADWLGFGRTVTPALRPCLRALSNRAERFVHPKKMRTIADQPVASVSQGQSLLWYHLFACDSHNDAIATALGVLGGALEDLRSPESARLVDEMMPSF